MTVSPLDVSMITICIRKERYSYSVSIKPPNTWR